MVLRKGFKGEYFMDKLNPKYWDERYYQRENFSTPKEIFENSTDSFFNKINETYKKEEIKRERENFNPLDVSAINKTFLMKRTSIDIENKILDHRLKGTSPKSYFEESLFENLQFSENNFCEKFLKKMKNK